MFYITALRNEGPIRPETWQSWCFILLSPNNTDFALAMKRGDFVLFLNDIYKYAFSFSLARTVRLFVKFSIVMCYM